MPTDPSYAEEDKDLTPEEKAEKHAQALAARDAIDTAAVPRSEVHTYKDGSQRVGTPPFPAMSPIEEAESKLERVGAPPIPPMTIPQGMPTSGERAPSAVDALSIEELRALAQRQLDSDLASGKSPDTPNPTTDSNKPHLAGTAGEVGVAEPTAEELEAIAKSIKPSAEGATDEQAEAAVTQVLRETNGPIVDDEKKSKKK